jgi:NADPH:quinone reductase-like Zn-dependent oxidoreductase
MKIMKALRAHRRGGPEELVFEDAPFPTALIGDVIVQVHAAAVTPSELQWDATWTSRDGRDRTPIIPSHEFSGVVAHTGPEVEKWSVGDQVIGLVDFDRNGAAAEFVTLASGALARRPLTLSYAECAAIPLAALTAWQALVDHGRVKSDERVLVVGGAGGVGLYAVQIAHHLRAIVTATARAGDRQLVEELGADEIVDFQHEPLPHVSAGYDVVLNTVGGPIPDELYSLVRRGGRFVTLSGPPNQDLAALRGLQAIFFIVKANHMQLDHLARLADAGRLRSVVARTFPLSDGRRAFETGTQIHQPGKTVLVIR